MRTSSKALFGGTLLAAGLTAAAHAQFNFSYSNVQTYALEYAYLGSDSDFFSGAGGFAISSHAANATGSATSWASANSLQIRTQAAVSGSGGFAKGHDLSSYFSVGHDVAASLEYQWGQGYGLFYAYDLTDQTTLWFSSGNGSVSTQIQLLAGHQYLVSGYSVAQREGDRNTFWELTIPAPASGGLLGLAGLMATRRHRSATPNQ